MQRSEGKKRVVSLESQIFQYGCGMECQRRAGVREVCKCKSGPGHKELLMPSKEDLHMRRFRGKVERMGRRGNNISREINLLFRIL